MFFIKGDICSRDVVDSLFAEYRFDYVVNFAAESHVDRSIENPQLFLITNILGTQNLLDCARRAWVMGKDEQGYPTWRKGVRYHQVSTDEGVRFTRSRGLLYGRNSALSAQPVQRFQDKCGHGCHGLSRHLQNAGNDYPLFQ